MPTFAAKLEALEDHVVILPDAPPKLSEVLEVVTMEDRGRILTSSGIVISVGPGRVLDDGSRSAMPCEVGDHVLMSGYGRADFVWPDADGNDVDLVSVRAGEIFTKLMDR